MAKSLVKKTMCILLSLALALSVFGGMSFSALTQQSDSPAVALYEDFENGWPEGWTKQINGSFSEPWTICTGDHTERTPYSGNYNALAFQDEGGGVAWLYTPTLDLSGYTNLSLRLAYRNMEWASDNDFFYLYYRVNEGEWVQLFATEDAHDWTELELELPAGALAENVQLGFKMVSCWGYGVCLDAVKIWHHDPVLETIEAINAIGTVSYTEECKALIDAARNAYDALTDEEKEQVTNYATLTDAETAYAELAPYGTMVTYTVTWDHDTLLNSGKGDFSKDGISLIADPEGHVDNHFYNDKTNTFKNLPGRFFTKIEFVDPFYISAFNFPGANYTENVNSYTVIWEGNASEVSFDALIYDVQSIIFTIETPVSCPVTWMLDESNVIDSGNVAFGMVPTHAAPTKEADAQYTYTFAGWNDGTTTYPVGTDLPEVTGDTTYTAVFDSTVNEYDVTWKFDENNVIDTSTIAYGTVPTHADPTKEADEQYTYTFAGWNDGTTTYPAGTDLPEVTGDATYTATFEAVKKPVLKHSISLNGNIALNFYMNPEVVTVDDTVDFTWDLGSYSYTLKADDFVEGKGYKVAVCLPAAEMTYPITASVDGISQTDTYSVRDYCDVILSNEYAQSYQVPEDKPWQTYANLVALVKTMLDYGAKAQIAFDRTDVDLANVNIGYSMQDVDIDMVTAAITKANGNQTSDDLNSVAQDLSAKYFTSSLIFLSASTLRHYFTPVDGSMTMVNPEKYTGNQSDYYYFVEKADIPAAELDNLQTFTVGDTTFKYSALDYINAVLNSSMDMKYKDLAAATFWYNQAANTFFDPSV